jgi:hypothetical protein
MKNRLEPIVSHKNTYSHVRVRSFVTIAGILMAVICISVLQNMRASKPSETSVTSITTTAGLMVASSSFSLILNTDLNFR